MKPLQRLLFVIGPLGGLVLGGTVFFHHAEGWGYLDAYFFTVVTLSTVGYGNLVPITPLGKIATTIFIFVGLGIFALAVQQIGSAAHQRREEKRQRLIDDIHSQKREDDDKDPPA